MKVLFSFLLLVNVEVWAREVIIIEHVKNESTAEVVKNILINKFQIPTQLIQVKGVLDNCNDKSEAILQLCIMPNGTLEIKKINKYVLQNAFNVFLEKKDL